MRDRDDLPPPAPACADRCEALEAERDALQEELVHLQGGYGALAQQWRGLFAAFHRAALLVDGRGRVLELTEAAGALLGLPGAAAAHSLAQVFGPTAAGRLLAATEGPAARGPVTVAVEAGGSRTRPLPALAVEVRLLVAAGSADARRALLLCAADAADDHHELRLLRTLLDESPDLIYVTDTQGTLTYANAAVARLRGLAPQAVAGRRREELLGTAATMLHHSGDARVVLDGLPIHFDEEYPDPRQSGHRHFQTRKFAVRGPAGEVVGIAGVSREVTADYEREARRQLSDLVFSQSTDALAVLDQDGSILHVNPAFERLSGMAADTARGHPLWRVQPQSRLDPLTAAFWPTVTAHQGWSGEITSRALDGHVYTVRCTVTPLRDDTGRHQRYAVVQSNLTQLRMAQADVERLAAEDELTQLPNRRVMRDRLGQLVHYARRRQSGFSLLFLDLDHFKEVNDSLGHLVGDQLLRLIAERLRTQLRGQDTVARNGGDEFVILLPDTGAEAALALGRKLVGCVAEPVDLAGLADYRPGLSVGVVCFPQHGEDADVLLRNADIAMYAAKSAGRNCVQLYTRAMSEESAGFLDIQKSLPLAIESNQLVLVFQPKVRLQDLATVGAEALVRWARPGIGLLGPGDFLDIAQRSGLLKAVDSWVLNAAMATAATWHAQGLLPPGWRLSVNQTATDLGEPDWLDRVQTLLQAHRLPPEYLEIELTESQLTRPTPHLLGVLEGLRELGVALSVDDFGTGYSSLAYLKHLPISVMKIDGSFVTDLAIDARGRALMESMVGLGHRLGYEVVAECVETPEQLQCLQAMGCDVGQGWLLSSPLPADAFAQMLQRG